MKYVFERGSGAMIYIPGFIDWFRLSIVDMGGFTDTQTNRELGDLISLKIYGEYTDGCTDSKAIS
jgi:hypothetical protein